MEKGKRKNRDLTEREMDILFVLFTLEEVPERMEILEELELAQREAKKPGSPWYRGITVKRELDSLRKGCYVSKSMEITEKGYCALKNAKEKKNRKKLSLNWEEVLAVVGQSRK